jgi:hypothetical protein
MQRDQCHVSLGAKAATKKQQFEVLQVHGSPHQASLRAELLYVCSRAGWHVPRAKY